MTPSSAMTTVVRMEPPSISNQFRRRLVGVIGRSNPRGVHARGFRMAKVTDMIVSVVGELQRVEDDLARLSYATEDVSKVRERCEAMIEAESVYTAEIAPRHPASEQLIAAHRRERDEHTRHLKALVAQREQCERRRQRIRDRLISYTSRLEPRPRCVRATPRRPACRQQSRQRSRSIRRAAELKSATGDSGDGDPASPGNRRYLPAAGGAL